MIARVPRAETVEGSWEESALFILVAGPPTTARRERVRTTVRREELGQRDNSPPEQRTRASCLLCGCSEKGGDVWRQHLAKGENKHERVFEQHDVLP